MARYSENMKSAVSDGRFLQTKEKRKSRGREIHMLESQKRANEKWLKANYEQIAFRAPKGTKEEIKAAAAAHGMSMAAYIQAACKEKAER
jgi:predicted HicB family RNase H-like nuclease